MNRIYLLSHLVITAIILNVMLSGNKAATKDEMNYQHIYRNNKRLAMGLFLGYLLGVV